VAKQAKFARALLWMSNAKSLPQKYCLETA